MNDDFNRHPAYDDKNIPEENSANAENGTGAHDADTGAETGSYKAEVRGPEAGAYGYGAGPGGYDVHDAGGSADTGNSSAEAGVYKAEVRGPEAGAYGYGAGPGGYDVHDAGGSADTGSSGAEAGSYKAEVRGPEAGAYGYGAGPGGYDAGGSGYGGGPGGDAFGGPSDNGGNGGNGRRKRKMRPAAVAAASVLGAVLLGLAVVGTMSLSGLNPGGAISSSASAGGSSKPALTVSSQPATAEKTSATAELTVAQVAAKVTPAVVGIVDYSTQSVQPTAEGSGIVMTADGYIVTNAHVISGADQIQVVVPKGKTYTAKVVGSDTQTDLAVLKIDTGSTKLQYATFGDSSQLSLGQSVVAIGNPGGLTLANTVTNGIVSGLNRTVGSSSTMKYIQTNALINPGNSGGPLVNMYGQVVGINSSKIEETGYEGIGFSIPIDSAKSIVDDLIANGYVTGRVQVGISVYPLSTAYTQTRGLPSGLYVTSVDQSSDAYAKGLRQGDIITKINGVSLSSDDSDTVYNNFYAEETKYKAGQTITLTVYRYDTGNTSSLSVKLAEDKGTSGTTSSDSTQENGSADGSYGNSGTYGSDGSTYGSSGSDSTGGSSVYEG